jgi:hypothetical protein
MSVSAEKLAQLEQTLSAQISQVEAELRTLQLSSSSARSQSPSLSTPRSRGSQWDQVLGIVRQGQEDEALFALIRVVQRALDERAPRKALAEKVTNAYLDSLFERVTGGVQDNLRQCTAESLARLERQVAEVKTRLMDLRKFLQVELQDIEMQMESLKDPCNPRRSSGSAELSMVPFVVRSSRDSL